MNGSDWIGAHLSQWVRRIKNSIFSISSGQRESVGIWDKTELFFFVLEREDRFDFELSDSRDAKFFAFFFIHEELSPLKPTKGRWNLSCYISNAAVTSNTPFPTPVS